MTPPMDRTELIARMSEAANKSHGFRQDRERADRIYVERGMLLDAIAALEIRPAPTEERIATVADYNAAFDPADEAFGGAFRDGFREGWIYAQSPDGTDYEELTEEYGRSVDIEPSEAWDGFRDKYFAMLPLAAFPEIGKPLATDTTPSRDEEGSVDREAVLRNVIAHATGGNLDIADHPGIGLNDICVQISQHHNRIWQGGIERGSALKTSTPKTQTVEGGGPDHAGDANDMIATPERSMVLEEAAQMLEAAISSGYPTPPNKADQCEHGKFGWEDCIACYDEQLQRVADNIRALSASPIEVEKETPLVAGLPADL